MDKQDFLNRITAIGTCEDDAERRTLLANLSTDVESVFDSNATLTEENNNYKDANEKLRSANMDLFLQIGKKDEPDPDPNKDEEKEKLSFDNLFNEKGELK